MRGSDVGGAAEVEALQEDVGPLEDHRRWEMRESTNEAEVLFSGQVVVDRGELPRESDGGARAHRLPRDVEAEYLGATPVGGQEGGEDPHCGGLPGSVGAEEAEDGARGDFEGHAVEGVDVSVVLDEVDGANGRRRGCVAHGPAVKHYP